MPVTYCWMETALGWRTDDTWRSQFMATIEMKKLQEAMEFDDDVLSLRKEVVDGETFYFILSTEDIARMHHDYRCQCGKCEEERA